MKFNCMRSDLSRAVSNVSRAVSSKSSQPALEGVLITAKESILRLTGYDLEIGITTEIEASVEQGGEVVVSAKLFSDILRNLPEEIVSIETDERLITTINSGSSQYQIVGISSAEYPELPRVEELEKITLDSATLMNKGLEIIEASRLFHFDADHISVLIHPQSIVHSMVEYRDGTIMANLSKPDMRLPIQYAMTYPARAESVCRPLSLDLEHPLEFYPADLDRFRAIRMAYDALRSDGVMPTVYNGANERAAELYFAGNIGFADIENCVEAALNTIENRPADSVETIAAADAAARYAVDRFVKMLNR